MGTKYCLIAKPPEYRNCIQHVFRLYTTCIQPEYSLYSAGILFVYSRNTVCIRPEYKISRELGQFHPFWNATRLIKNK